MISHEEVAAEPAIASLLSKGYSIATIHRYLSSAGEELFCRVRLEHPTKGKEIRPVYRAAGDVVELGEPDNIKNGPKPLYGLHALAAYPHARVWVVEGEKCADSLNEAFKREGVGASHVAVTSGSATSADKADWSPLQARAVTIWPDNDASGFKYRDALMAVLKDVAAEVESIAVEAVCHNESEDCVDWLAANNAATIASFASFPRYVPSILPEEVKLIRMSTVTLTNINWLWPERIALGKITVIAGEPGVGKSQISAYLSAAVSKGLLWPDVPEHCPLGSVVILSAEDEPADTIGPRLVAAGADLDKCHVLEAVRDEHNGKIKERGFNLVEDVQRLGRVLDSLGDARLVVIDPITAYLGNTDSHNNAEIRGVLAPLAEIAAQRSVAIVLVTHFNKSNGQSATARVIGSIGLIAAARGGFAATKDETNPDVRHFLPIKNNIGNDKTGLSYIIEEVVVNVDIRTSRVVWQVGTVDAHGILNPPPATKPTTQNEAAKWLREYLDGKTVVASEVIAEGQAAGFNKSAINRAADMLRMVRKKRPVKDGGWDWTLPGKTVVGEECEERKESEKIDA